MLSTIKIMSKRIRTEDNSIEAEAMEIAKILKNAVNDFSQSTIQEILLVENVESLISLKRFIIYQIKEVEAKQIKRDDELLERELTTTQLDLEKSRLEIQKLQEKYEFVQKKIQENKYRKDDLDKPNDEKNETETPIKLTNNLEQQVDDEF